MRTSYRKIRQRVRNRPAVRITLFDTFFARRRRAKVSKTATPLGWVREVVGWGIRSNVTEDEWVNLPGIYSDWEGLPEVIDGDNLLAADIATPEEHMEGFGLLVRP